MISITGENKPMGVPRLRYLSIPRVRAGNDFLGEKIKQNREVTLPHIMTKCYEAGIVENFHRAAGIREGDYIGLHNSDEFLYKTIEAASYCLMDTYDPKLDEQVDAIIDVIASAQEPDGYLRTPHTIYWLRGGRPERAPRWSRLDQDLELYSLGHMIEAAVAHFKATGKSTLLSVAIKSADMLDSLFGIGKPMRGVDMIPEIELALVKLYEVTGEKRYIDLAGYFLEERGDASGHKLQGEMALDHLPLREQPEAVGHATFAAYLYSGAADLAYQEHDTSFVPAINRLWYDAITRKMSINGGFGARHDNEGFSAAYDIPNLTAYNEICAAVGFCNLNQRMFKLDHDGKYFDVMERTIYNNLLSGVSMDGKAFFYVCPTESDCHYKFNLGWCPGDYDGPYREPMATRKEWIPCACCPPTLARLLPQLPSYAYAVEENDVYINLYLSSQADLEVGRAPVRIVQTTEYPWQEKITVTIRTEKPAAFRLRMRIPGWLKDTPIHGDLYRYADTLSVEPVMTLNGQPVSIELEKGYAVLEREWTDGDTVELMLPLQVRLVVSHPAVRQNEGKVALQRGPVLYCAEGVDNNERVLDIAIPDTAMFDVQYEPDLLGGVYMLTGDTCRIGEGQEKQPQRLVAIPYYAWSNRGENEMVVWFHSV